MTAWAAPGRPADRVAGQPVTALEAVETGFYALTLLLMSEALLGPVFAPVEGQDPPAWLQLMWLPIYAVITGFLVLRAPRLGRVWVGGLATLALVAFAFMSVSWSVAPDITLRRSVALLFTSLLGCLIAARYSWRGMVELFAATFLILAVGSLISALAFPSLGVDDSLHVGAWQGLWLEKNQLGAAMAKGVLACVSAAVLAPARRLFWIASAVLCGTLVLLSTSTTALLAMLVVLAGGIALAGLRQGGLLMLCTFWLMLVLLIGLGGLVALAPDALLGAFGKDATLTGRTGLWEALSRRIELRPWEGYGYGAFWSDPQGPAFYVRRDVGWRAPTAHNGWLEVLVQLGWMGLALFAAHFALSAAAAGRRLVSGGEGMWAVLSTVLFVLFSLSESTIMQQNNINWVLYVATTAKLLERRRSPAGAAAYAALDAGRGLAGTPAASVRRTSAAP